MFVPQSTTGYVVALEAGCWLSQWSGDPGRTRKKHWARQYKTLHGARIALGFARKYRPFENAQILPYVV